MNTPQIRIDELNERDVLITPNLRSARLWAREAGALAAERGQPVPIVVAESVWLAQTWEAMRALALSEAEALPRLLSANEERALWQWVVDQSERSTQLAPHTIVPELTRAWKLARQWNCPDALLAADAALEVQSYAQWQKTFRARLRAKGWLTAAELTTELTKRLIEERFAPLWQRLQRIVRVPAVHDNPAMQRLLDAYAQIGVTQAQLRWSDSPCSPQTRLYSSAQNEWVAAARWAGNIVRAQPNATVVIVVPNLHAHRHTLRRILRDELVPEHWGDPFTESGERFNLSLGMRLTDMPRVAAALMWLRWLQVPIAIDDARLALAAAFLPSAPSWAAEAIERGTQRLTLAHFAKTLSPTHPAHAALRLRAGWPKRLLPSDWAARFSDVLTALEFDCAWMDSVSAQASVALREQIEGLADLDELVGPCASAAMLEALQERVHQHDFQGEGQNAPVQVLGVYESLGIASSAMWLTGLDAEVLPEPRETSPLLPRAWQFAAKAGRADAQAMIDAAQRMWAQWTHASTQWVVSTSQNVDGAAAQFAACSQLDATALAVEPALEARVHTMAETERLDDTVGEPFNDSALPGGTALLQQQAQCAFQAYATQRLGAQPFPRTQIGLPAYVLGNAVHEALRWLWSCVQTSSAWIEASEAECMAWVGQAVDAAFSLVTVALQERNLPRALEDALREHLAALLATWMDSVESQRSDFAVSQTEITLPLTLANRSLKVRLDRVDTLACGATMVIDYKTGTTSGIEPLRDHRAPQTPQLPAYALAMQQSGDATLKRVGAVAYAKVKAHALALQPLYSTGEVRVWNEPKKNSGRSQVDTEQWATQLAQWESALTQTVEAFCRGEARVAPVRPSVCSTCGRQALCRIGSAADVVDDDAPEETDDAI